MAPMGSHDSQPSSSARSATAARLVRLGWSPFPTRRMAGLGAPGHDRPEEVV
jgi:hypothetical protein